MTNQESKISITVHLPVRLDELDYLGIVHHANYLKYMEHVRLKLIEQQGVDLMDWVKKGYRALVANDTLNYRHPATYGDTLTITCQVEDVGQSSVRFGYRMVNEKTGNEVVQATTIVVAVDANGRPTPVPQEIREALGEAA